MAELWPDEDADPRLLFGEADRSRKRNTRLMQLCRQVERALTLALADASDEPALVAAVMGEVEPAPDASRLRVRVRVPVSPERLSAVPEARVALARLGARLRREVAQGIRRKRAPELVFDVCPEEGTGD